MDTNYTSFDRRNERVRETFMWNEMLDCGLYNAYDNDNQVNTTIWQVTKIG